MKLELSGCIILKEKSVLLLKRKDQGHWEIPGGKIREGDTPEQTALREAQEETGCKIKILKFLGNFDMYVPKKNITVNSYYYLAKIIEGTPRVTEPEVFSNIKYIHFLELEKINLAPNIKMILEGKLKNFEFK
ncbi:MAG: NUDIX hydrolase [Nanoarchaeota archaeon]|nr:NUDIX hydrolase [Nanoarchaeota archaeon]